MEIKERLNKKAFKELKKFPENFIVLDIAHPAHRDKENLTMAIEVLNTVNCAAWANSIGRQFNSSDNINESIFYKAIELILGEHNAFTNEQLELFFNSMAKLDSFFYSVDQYNGEYYIPNEVIFLLFGLTVSTYKKLPEGYREKLHSQFYKLSRERNRGKLEVSEFVKKMKETISDYNKTPEQINKEIEVKTIAEMDEHIKKSERKKLMMEELIEKRKSKKDFSGVELDFLGLERNKEGKLVDKTKEINVI